MPIDNGDVVFNWVPFLGAIVQIFNVWLYSLVCPLKFRPLVCHVSASNALSTTTPPAVAKFGALHVKVSTRVFLRASAISMFLVGGMCYVANKWVLGDEAIASLGFREHLLKICAMAPIMGSALNTTSVLSMSTCVLKLTGWGSLSQGRTAASHCLPLP